MAELREDGKQVGNGASPQRTCVGCRRVTGKGGLVRLVKGVEGQVAVDREGGGAGRGAYLCAVRSCWVKGLKFGQMERALRVKIGPQEKEALLSEVDGTNKEVSS